MLLYKNIWRGQFQIFPRHKSFGLYCLDGQGRNRTADTRIFSPRNYVSSGFSHLKYPIFIGIFVHIVWDGEKFNFAEKKKATVREFNTKTLREREAALSKRLKEELQKLWDESDKKPDSLVFGITNNVSRSFNSVCQSAEIEDLRFHDLRRTFGTRLAKKGVPIHEIARRLGHTDIETTFIYLGLTKDSLETAANAIDEWNEEIAKMIANANP